MEKKKLFISYYSENIDKVRHIKKELENHPLFEPLVVADKRKANSALTKLVSEGIDMSYRLIPILSPQSYRTQWINQEIGYAICKNIPIIPIVEVSILDDLKGFVHKQNQCPYTYKAARKGVIVRDENKGFMSSFRLLIEDLKEELGNYSKDFINVADHSLKIQRQSYYSDYGDAQTKNSTGGKFLKRSGNNGYFIRLLASNGEHIFTSEIIKSKSTLDSVIASIQENCDKDDRYVRKITPNSKHYFILKSWNGQIIGNGQLYTTKAAMESGIEAVKRNGKSNIVEDKT